ncbi:MAG: cyclic nucleotide-binding domain-containing protein [Candidatus Hydrogenedentes bacterium]|nr:cyclic nucleotide-binding domain-containing protein [Candidatus Hydrogenedentota bacterium]
MMTNEEVRELVSKVPFIAHLPHDLGEKLTDVFINIGAIRRVAEGQLMTREGSHGKNRGFILLGGVVGVQKMDAPFTKCRPPELLGEVMQFNPKAMRTATLTAREECTVLRFEWNEFWNSLMSNLSEAEVAKVRETLEARAWEHFTA